MTAAEGFAAVPNWMIRDADSGLTIWGLAVYAALASHSGKGGIRPSVRTLAREARCSETKVRESLVELEGIGVVKVTRRIKARGVNDTNSYTLRPNGKARGTSQREVPPTSPGEPGVPRSTGEGTSPGDDEEEPLKKNPSRISSSEAVQTVGSRFAEPLCNVLVELMKANGAKTPEGIPRRWLDDARLLVDRDGRDPHEAKALMEWAAGDSFWRGNILSVPKFREKYDQLRMQAERKHPGVVDAGRAADDILRSRASERQAIAS